MGEQGSLARAPTAAESAGAGPIFLFTMHRSGGTLLQRLVNRQPKVVIWGEHGGFINNLAETDELMSHFGNVCSALPQRRLPEFLANRGLENFDPWTNPAERVEYRKFAREFIRSAFSTGLREGQRWGFKEIRYHTPRTAKFLTQLFPWARIVLLRTDLPAVVVSCITAPWSLKALKGISTAQVPQVVGEVAYAAAAMSHGFDAILRELPAHVIAVPKERLHAEAKRLFDFLLLPDMDVTEVLRRRIGGSDETATLASVGRRGLSKMAEEALAAARDEIGRDGIDVPRILRSRFSFLAGDHWLAGSGLSSLF